MADDDDEADLTQMAADKLRADTVRWLSALARPIAPWQRSARHVDTMTIRFELPAPTARVAGVDLADHADRMVLAVWRGRGGLRCLGPRLDLAQGWPLPGPWQAEAEADQLDAEVIVLLGRAVARHLSRVLDRTIAFVHDAPQVVRAAHAPGRYMLMWNWDPLLIPALITPWRAFYDALGEDDQMWALGAEVLRGAG